MPLHQLREAFFMVLAREALQELPVRQAGRANCHCGILDGWSSHTIGAMAMGNSSNYFVRDARKLPGNAPLCGEIALLATSRVPPHSGREQTRAGGGRSRGRVARSRQKLSDWGSPRGPSEGSELQQVMPIAEQHRALGQKLRRHYPYYGGVMGNQPCLQRFRYRCSVCGGGGCHVVAGTGTGTWERFNPLLRQVPLPWPQAWVSPCAANPLTCLGPRERLCGQARYRVAGHQSSIHRDKPG